MPIVSTQTAINIVISVAITQLLTQPQLTLITCNMYNFKDQPEDCNPEESQNEPVNSSRRTKTVMASYATIISTVLERLSEQKSELKTNSSDVKVR